MSATAEPRQTDAVWTTHMDATVANTHLVEDHVIPALLWAMRR